MNLENTLGKPVPAKSVTVAYTGTAGTVALGDAAFVRLVATTDCFIELTTAATAAVANTGMYLPARSPEYFKVAPGTSVSAIQVSSGGSIYATPIE
jgi:hypothetical protein